jgi:hypothetical protein
MSHMSWFVGTLFNKFGFFLDGPQICKEYCICYLLLVVRVCFVFLLFCVFDVYVICILYVIFFFLCVMFYLCVILVQLPPGENPLAV